MRSNVARQRLLKRMVLRLHDSYHRKVYEPGDDVSEAPEEVRKVARVLWDRNIDPEFGVDVTPEGAE